MIENILSIDTLLSLVGLFFWFWLFNRLKKSESKIKDLYAVVSEIQRRLP
jgi:hypothetical protein